MPDILPFPSLVNINGLRTRRGVVASQLLEGYYHPYINFEVVEEPLEPQGLSPKMIASMYDPEQDELYTCDLVLLPEIVQMRDLQRVVRGFVLEACKYLSQKALSEPVCS